ncbi:Protein of unknown function DUF115 [Thalassovita gelatinovora]|uniref:6-hydroxymethylpterin diphosphokinase MptE-like protein n=1 Tax=Thalassovita gelatinovora TaxID=53501 RepID=UPI0008B22BBF|nr:6-hydroxymethylpterin diphosphokinase MptE-like protein [Thalassovita gelatinovora]QIZ82667.1 DUF115 domain-containing protein [Thalassovita gelatinovora]SER11204.1 Protein of unknown function DUF115 [Thalassovita gelatinovora]
MQGIQSFYMKHKGERCFILGNGPSLNKIEIPKLASEVSFGVNSIFLMSRDSGFYPTYYVVEDNLVFRDNKESIDAYRGPTKILPERYALELTDTRDCFTFDMDTSFYNKNKPESYSVPHFNGGPETTFHCGQSVTYINMQLAYYMGFSEVYLIGMDFSYSKPPSHEQSGNHIHSHGDDPNHFHKDYFGKGKTWKDPRLGRVLRSYVRAKHAFETDGRLIANATPGGELELFPRVSFNSLFG